MKAILTLTLMGPLIALSCLAQETPPSNFNLQAGLTYNQASGSDNPTGVGLYLQGHYLPTANLRFGVRIEPTLLAEGEYTQDSDPPIRGGASCLVNNYLSMDFLLGNEKFNAVGKVKPRFYVSTQAILSTHRVYVGVGNERERQSYFGMGAGVGCDVGPWDCSTSMNIMPGDGLMNYVSVNVGYTLWRNAR